MFRFYCVEFDIDIYSVDPCYHILVNIQYKVLRIGKSPSSFTLSVCSGVIYKYVAFIQFISLHVKRPSL